MARRPRRPLGPLDLRTQAILRAVIEEYVTTATPVGSQALDDGPKDRLRAKVQGAEWAAWSSRQGLSPILLALYG